jgi:hypothetical protein
MKYICSYYFKTEEDYNNVVKWLKSSFKIKDYQIEDDVYLTNDGVMNNVHFKHIQDATLFKLVWSN